MPTNQFPISLIFLCQLLHKVFRFVCAVSMVEVLHAVSVCTVAAPCRNAVPAVEMPCANSVSICCATVAEMAVLLPNFMRIVLPLQAQQCSLKRFSFFVFPCVVAPRACYVGEGVFGVMPRLVWNCWLNDIKGGRLLEMPPLPVCVLRPTE